MILEDAHCNAIHKEPMCCSQFGKRLVIAGGGAGNQETFSGGRRRHNRIQYGGFDSH
jgi:hypothetical protein